MKPLDALCTTTALAGALALALAGTAAGQDTDTDARQGVRAPVALTGEIVEVGDARFKLDTGVGVVTVGVDEGDWFAEGDEPGAAPLEAGESVVVTGTVDARFYDERHVEAFSVYARERDTLYGMDGAMQTRGEWRGFGASRRDRASDRGVEIAVVGEVAEIEGREFTMRFGADTLRVDTARLGYDPMDDTGEQKIEAGDEVRVSGSLDDTFFGDRLLVADRVTSFETATPDVRDDS